MIILISMDLLSATIGTPSSLQFSTKLRHHEHKKWKYLIFHILGHAWILNSTKAIILNLQVLNFLHRGIFALLATQLNTFLNANLLHFKTKFICFNPTETHPYHSLLIELELIVIFPSFNFINSWFDSMWFCIGIFTKIRITAINFFTQFYQRVIRIISM